MLDKVLEVEDLPQKGAGVTGPSKGGSVLATQKRGLLKSPVFWTVAYIVLILLFNDFWWWNTYEPLIFGWVPVWLFWEWVLHLVFWIGIFYYTYKVWPEPPAEYRVDRQTPS